MNGLDTLNRLMDPKGRAELEAALLSRDLAVTPAPAQPETSEVESRSTRISLIDIPPVPDLDRHLEEVRDLDEVWSYINPQMLYGKHLGFRGRFVDALAAGDIKARELEDKVERVKDECRAGAMKVRAVWQFFRARPDGNKITILSSPGTSSPRNASADASQVNAMPLADFRFPRQRKEDGLALSDFVLPPRTDSNRGPQYDHIAMFVTTAGEGIRELAEAAKTRGEYLRSYALQALAIETAEAAAEWLHARLRAAWGFPDAAGTPRQALFQARYRGKRYSFGYPACPDLEQQADLFRLLGPEQIGVQLTEGFMMEPEASVSALVFHHPDAVYFSAGARELSEVVAD
jgi:5-methyltetrahydrofolate--homocysteine methyltransferase